MKKKLLITIAIIAVLILLSDECFAGPREKIVQKTLKFLSKYLDDLFRYLGLMGLLVFMKTISWSKMLMGSFLSIIGALYPVKKESNDDKGEAKIEIPKFKLFIKGSLRFALVIAGVILIIGSIMSGVNGHKEYKSTTKNGFIGIQYVIDGNKNVIITKIMADSPAEEANLKVNDRILSVDDKMISEAKLESISELFKGEPGTFVRIKTQRNDSISTYYIKRKDLQFVIE